MHLEDNVKKFYQEFLSEELEKKRLSKGHFVTSDHKSKEFMNEYTKAIKGFHRTHGYLEGDEKATNRFQSTYDAEVHEHGFGGSGSTIYTHKKTGHQYLVSRKPNGMGFYGYHHHVISLGVKKPEAEPKKINSSNSETSEKSNGKTQVIFHNERLNKMNGMF